jgi:hypothetical protein
MKLIDVKIDWMIGWSNDPRLLMFVEDLPKASDLRYEKNGDLYFAEKDGFVSFFAWAGKPSQGFGGREIPITMKDESVVILQGPWSSNCGVMNDIGFTPSMEVSYTNDQKAWNGDGIFYAGAMTVEFCSDALKTIGEKIDAVGASQGFATGKHIAKIMSAEQIAGVSPYPRFIVAGKKQIEEQLVASRHLPVKTLSELYDVPEKNIKVFLNAWKNSNADSLA